MPALPTQVFRPSPETVAHVATLRGRADLRGLSAIVVGAGRSGLSAARLLSARGMDVRFADDRGHGDLAPDLRQEIAQERLGPLEVSSLEASDLVVLSPGVPKSRPELSGALRRGTLVGEVELASWFTKSPLIGITGTNGKSTTTALVGHILSGAGLRTFVGGNLGRPATEMADAQYDVGVLELSSYQLESLVSARFRVGVWLNLTPDHLDRYPDVSHYAAAKARLFEHLEPGGIAVLNAEDPLVSQWGRSLPSVSWFSAADVGPEILAPALPGRHNLSNIAAALESVAPFPVSDEHLRASLASFPGLPHRLERVRELNGVVYYNDSKATNVDSAVTAVRALAAPKVLILGGKDKGGSWQPLVEASRGSVHAVLAVGQAAPLVTRAFAGVVPKLEDAGTLEAAVRRASELARPGDVVLLSPACASFDQFKNFEHRGDEFRRLVFELAPPRRAHG